MKRLILTSMAAALFMPLFAVNPLIIRDKDNDTALEIEKLSHVVFHAAGGISVYRTDGSVTFVPADKFVSLRFNTAMNGVESVGSDSAGAIAYSGGVISSGEPGIAVYNASGACVASTAGETLSTAGIAPGVYVVTAGKSTLKIVVK